MSLNVNLGIKDLWDDRYVSLCVVAALVAVITPLLLLLGLKNGVITQLQDELLRNPDIRAIKLVGNHQLSQDWVDQLANKREVGFVVPMTRSLNTEVGLIKDSTHFIEHMELLPSAKGDPLLMGSVPAPSGLNDIVLIQKVATRLGVNVGDSVKLLSLRHLEGKRERGQRRLVVTGIVPNSVFNRSVGLVSLALLVAVEDFKDGFASPDLSVGTGSTGSMRGRTFAKVRLYANGLNDVSVLDEWFGTQNLEVISQLPEIESVMAIDRLLSLVFSIVAWTAVLGAVASFTGALLSNIDRKRKNLAILRLMGLSGGDIVLFILSQALVLAGVAFIMSILVFGVGKVALDQALVSYLPEGAYVCYLGREDFIVACFITLLLATVIASVGGLRALKVEPAESLRDF